MNSGGYTKIPNEVLDNMNELSPAEFKLAMLFFRLTVGWHEEKAETSISELSRLTGLSRRGVRLAMEGIKHLFSYNEGVVLSTSKLETEYQGGGTEYQLGGTQFPVLHLPKEKKESIKKERKGDPLIDLVNHFADVADVERPNGEINKKKWLDPIVTMYHAANDNYGQTKRLISDTTRYLKEKGYKVLTPASIVKTATSIEFVQSSRGVSDV